MFFAGVVYLLIGGVMQLLFELAWRYEKLSVYPGMWPAVLAGVLLWPLTVISLLGWAMLSLLRKL